MIAILLLLVLLIILGYYYFFRCEKLTFPGPRGLPIVGPLFHINSKFPPETLTKWAKEYGDVYCIRLWGGNAVVVNSYDLIYDVLVKRGNVFMNRINPYRAVIWCDRKGLFLAHPYMPHWRPLRKVTQRFITLNNVGTDEIEQVVMDVVRNRMDKFASLNGKPFEASWQLYRFAISVTHILVFGEDVKSEEILPYKEFTEKFMHNLAVFGKGRVLDEFAWLRFFYNRVYINMKECRQTAEDIWKMKTDQYFNLGSSEQPNSAMKSVLNFKNTLMGSENIPGIEDQHNLISVLELMLAGASTTSSTLSAFLILLLHYPEVQQKLQQEVDMVVGREETVTMAKRNEMPYTRAAIYEVLRYTSILPLGIPHQPMHATNINGHVIPENTVVIINYWMLHHDEDFWGDPLNFRPDRFLDDYGNLLLADHPRRKRLLPFGAGPRVCPGGVFATNRIFLFMTSLMQKFDVLPENSNKLPPCHPSTYVTGLVFFPGDFKLRLAQRSQ